MIVKAEECIDKRIKHLSNTNIINHINDILSKITGREATYIVVKLTEFKPDDIDVNTEDIIWYYTKLGYDVKVNGYTFSATKNRVSYYEYVIISW